MTIRYGGKPGALLTPDELDVAFHTARMQLADAIKALTVLHDVLQPEDVQRVQHSIPASGGVTYTDDNDGLAVVIEELALAADSLIANVDTEPTPNRCVSKCSCGGLA